MWPATPFVPLQICPHHSHATVPRAFPREVGGEEADRCGARGLHAAPKAQKSTLTLPPGSAEQLASFRAEEERRYAAPEKAFVFSCLPPKTPSWRLKTSS